MIEKWKPFRHGYYEVSNLGRVRRVKPGSNNTYPGKILKPYPGDREGYLRVRTSRNNKFRNHRLSVLVARKFIGPCPPDKEVNHKDLDKTNCRWDNLEYITHKKNIRHAIRNGVKFNARLIWEEVCEIRRLFATGKYHVRSKTLAKQFDVTAQTIRDVVLRLTWKKRR